jgi:hypothetical protein
MPEPLPEPLHPDFEGLSVRPGELRVAAAAGEFGLLNLLAFGGARDRVPHVPAEVGAIGDVVLWESTGAADALPFWNTNYHSDVYLVLLHGEVRVEFKEPERETLRGTCIGRTGDLLKLPRGIAHRTFSTNGRRRISLELLRRNPHWHSLGRGDGVPAASSTRLGGFEITVGGEHTTVRTAVDEVRTPNGFLRRGLMALIAYELHLDHNEFEGGFVVHDLGETTVLKTPHHQETFPNLAVLALLKAVAARLEG